MNNKNPEKTICWILLLGIIVAYFWAIASRAGIPAMWGDELSVRCIFATKPLSTLLKSPVSLSYILCKFFDGIFYNDFFVRIPMIAGGLMIVIGTYFAVSQFGSRYVGILAAWSILWHPLFTSHVLRNRFYILGTGFMYCSWAVAVWALRKNNFLAWGIYAVVAFIASHIWPWNAPWIGLIAVSFALPVIIKSWGNKNLIKSLTSSFQKLFLLGLPVILFGIHYLYASGKIESISKSGNDSFWKKPVDIGINYVFDILREALQPLFPVNVEYLLLILIVGILIAAILREWKLLVFVVCTVVVWLVAVYMCNQTNIVPISRRIMFSRLNFIIVIFGCLSVFVKYLSQLKFCNIIRKKRKLYFSLHILSGVFILSIGLLYGWDKMITAHGKVTFNFSHPFNTYGQIIKDNISSNAYIVVQEDGTGLAWGVDAYAVKPANLTNVEIKTFWSRAYSHHRISKKTLEKHLKKYSQVWFISSPSYINKDIADILNKNAVKIPFNHNIWLCEKKFEKMNSNQKNDWIRNLMLEVNEKLPPLDVYKNAMSNLIVRLSDAEIKNNFLLLMNQRVRRQRDNYKLADLFAKYGFHDDAIKSVMSPIYFLSRQTYIYEALGKKLLDMSKTFPSDTKNKYQMAALKCYKSALLRNSPTALNKLNEIRNIIRMNNGIKNEPDKIIFDENKSTIFHALCQNKENTNSKLTYTNIQKFVSAKSISVAVLFNTSTNTNLNIIVGRGKGSSDADSPWWLSLLNKGKHTQFVMQFINGKSKHFQHRLTARWNNIWNDNWHCFVGTFDNDKKKMCFYIDGFIVNSKKFDKDVKRNATDVPLTIGCLFNGYFPFKGKIREVAIYSKALPAKKIKSVWEKIYKDQK